MPDFFTTSGYQGTFTPGTVEVDPVYQICSVGSLNASVLLKMTFWVNKNGQRVDTDLGEASYVIRDRNGDLVSGMAESSILPDSNGYYLTSEMNAALIYDLTHYVVEIEIDVDGTPVTGSIGMALNG